METKNAATITVSRRTFISAFESVLVAASTDSMREMLRRVTFRASAADGLEIAASDSYRLHRAKVWRHIDIGQLDVPECYISSEGLRRAVSIVANYTNSNDTPSVALIFQSRTVKIVAGSYTAEVRMHDDGTSFTAIDSMMSHAHEDWSARPWFNGSYLDAAISAAKTFIDGELFDNRIQLVSMSELNPCIIQAETGGGRFEAVVMPIRVPKR